LTSCGTPEERGNLLLKELFGDNRALRLELNERRAELPADNIFLASVLGNNRQTVVGQWRRSEFRGAQ